MRNDFTGACVMGGKPASASSLCIVDVPTRFRSGSGMMAWLSAGEK